MGSIGQDLWLSFKAVYGPITTPVALVLGVLGGLYAPAATVEVRLVWIVFGIILLGIGVMTAVNLIALTRQQAGRLPRVRGVFSSGPEGPGEAVELILLLDPSSLFGFDSLVSSYYNDNLGEEAGATFERLIGVGRIANVQQDRRFQVLILQEVRAYAALWRRVRDRDPGALARLVVRPSVPYGLGGMEVLING